MFNPFVPFYSMLGGFDAWLLSAVGGLDTEVNGTSAGWRNVIARIAPGAVTVVRSSSYTKLTQFGTVSLEWEFSNAKLSANLTLPIGASGTFHAPAQLYEDGTQLQLQALFESSNLIWGAAATSTLLPAGVQRVHESSDTMLARVGSGTYTFEARYMRG